MKKDKVKRIGLILFAVILAGIEFGLDMHRASRHSGLVIVVFVVLACFDLFRDVRKISKQTKVEDVPDEMSDAMGDAAVGAMSLLDRGLRKINPDYDPDAERNARKADPAAIAKLDEMKQAGLIDEKEYQRRKQELIGT